MRFGDSLIPIVLLGALVGCARSNHGSLVWEIEDSEIHAPADRAIVAGDQFVAEGTFRVARAPDGRSAPLVTVKIMGKTEDGKDIILWEKSAEPVGESDGKYKFRVDAQAPNKPGTYNLEAWQQGKRHSDAKVQVSANRND